jgi:hypothetical protein
MIPTPHSVKIYKSGQKDEWGMSIVGSPVDYKAFVQYSSNRTRSNEGEEVKIDLNITILGDVEVKYEDQLEFRDIKKHPISIEKIYDLEGTIIATKVLV